MSATAQSTAMTAIQEQIKKELASIKDTVAPPSGRNISTRGKVFTLPDGRTSQGPLALVILDHRSYNRYYTKNYDPKNPTAPDCFAIGKVIKELAPHADAEAKQSDDCASCTLNAWGSAPTGKGKACRNTVRLAVVPPDAGPEFDPMILQIPPTALKGWNGLARGLEDSGLLPVQVQVEVSFDPNQAYPCPQFKLIGAHDRLDVMWGLRTKAQSLLEQPPASD